MPSTEQWGNTEPTTPSKVRVCTCVRPDAVRAGIAVLAAQGSSPGARREGRFKGLEPKRRLWPRWLVGRKSSHQVTGSWAGAETRAQARSRGTRSPPLSPSHLNPEIQDRKPKASLCFRVGGRGGRGYNRPAEVARPQRGWASFHCSPLTGKRSGWVVLNSPVSLPGDPMPRHHSPSGRG